MKEYDVMEGDGIITEMTEVLSDALE